MVASDDNDGAPSSRVAALLAWLFAWLGDRRRGALVLVGLVFVLFGSATCWRRATGTPIPTTPRRSRAAPISTGR